MIIALIPLIQITNAVSETRDDKAIFESIISDIYNQEPRSQETINTAIIYSAHSFFKGYDSEVEKTKEKLKLSMDVMKPKGGSSLTDLLKLQLLHRELEIVQNKYFNTICMLRQFAFIKEDYKNQYFEALLLILNKNVKELNGSLTMLRNHHSDIKNKSILYLIDKEKKNILNAIAINEIFIDEIKKRILISK